MVTVMLVRAWGPYEARTICEMTESQAEPLLGTGVAMLVDLAPNPLVEPALQPAKTHRKRPAE